MRPLHTESAPHSFLRELFASWTRELDAYDRSLPTWEQLGLVPRDKHLVVLDETEEGFRAADKLIAELMNHDPYTCLMAATNARLTFPEPPLANLTATQARCTELLEENRRLKREAETFRDSLDDGMMR